MKPICLTISAFGPYATKQIIDFRKLKDRSFFLIHGPTGSGKTSILDGICFALYGNASGDTRTSKSLRSDYADISLPTIVEFEFSIGENRYLTKRWPEQMRPKKSGSGATIEHAGAELHCISADENQEVMATGWSEVTKQIEGLIGFKCEQFRQVVLLPQGEFRKLLTATSSERQEIMQTLFKTDIYRLIEEKLKAKAQEIKKEHDRLSHERSILLQEAATNSLGELEERMKTHKGQVQALGEQVQEANTLMQKAQKAFNEGQQIMALFHEHTEAQNTVTELQNKVLTVEQFRQDLEKALAAAKLEEAENHLRQQELDLERLKQDEEKYVQGLAQATRKLALTQEELKVQEAKEPERVQIATRILHLQQLSQGVQALVEAKEETAKTLKNLDLALKQKNTLKEQLDKYQKYLQENSPRLEVLKGISGEKGQRHLLLQNLQSILTKRQSLEETSSQLKKIESLAHAKEGAYKQATQDWTVAKESLAKLQELWIQGQAGLMAASLTPTSPCPVCGSLEHPSPAQPSSDTPSEKDLKELQKSVQELEKKSNEAQKAWQVQTNELERLASHHQYLTEELGDYGTMEFSALQELLNQAQSSYKESLRAEKQSTELAKKLHDVQTLLTQKQKEAEEVEQKWRNADSAHNKGLATLEERQRQIPLELQEPAALEKALETAQSLQQKLKNELESAQSSLQKAENDQIRIHSQVEHTRQSVISAHTRLLETSNNFQLRVQEAGFTSLSEYTQAKWSSDRIATVQKRIKDFELKLNSAQEHLQRAEGKIKDLTPPNLDSLQNALSQAQKNYEEILRQHTTLTQEYDRETHWYKRLKSLHQKMDKLSVRYGITGRLSEVANGNNEYRLTFQRFVLGALLDDVAVAANERLNTMSRGRYYLQRTMDRARKNMAGGLDLEVYDNYTGYARGVGTLSGGETFLASLSLALGLVDVVQSYAGGIHLDTLFVDEGFGTLDPESLDFAIKSLIDLQQGGRLVGIISHVPELKERIDARLEVSPGSKGSIATFKVG